MTYANVFKAYFKPGTAPAMPKAKRTETVPKKPGEGTTKDEGEPGYSSVFKTSEGAKKAWSTRKNKGGNSSGEIDMTGWLLKNPHAAPAILGAAKMVPAKHGAAIWDRKLQQDKAGPKFKKAHKFDGHDQLASDLGVV